MVLRGSVKARKRTPGQFSLDTYGVLYHGYAHTHMDALCHMFYQGKMFNGVPQSTVTAAGAQKPPLPFDVACVHRIVNVEL